MKHRTIVLIWMIAGLVFAQAQHQEGVHVMVDVSKGKPVYYFAGRIVTGDELLDRFNESVRTRGADVSVTMLFNPQLPIETIFNVRGIAGKSGLHSIRCFVVDGYWRSMLEIGTLQGNLPVPPWAASLREGQAKKSAR